jgi:hypothetical protein
MCAILIAKIERAVIGVESRIKNLVLRSAAQQRVSKDE